MFRKRLVFRIPLAPDKSYDSAMRKKTYAISLYRRDLCIYGGSRGQKKTFVRENGVPRDLWHCTFSGSFYHFGAAIVISSTFAVVTCGIEWEVFAHRGDFPLATFVFDLGHGAACYCLGSSLLRKESVFVVPLQLDSFVPVRDTGILKIMWILTSECVCGNERCHFRCPYPCWEIIINDLNHQTIDSVRGSWQLCLGLTSKRSAGSRLRWNFQSSL